MEMTPVEQGHTQPSCLYQFPHIPFPRTSSLGLGLAITSIALLLFLQQIVRHYRPARTDLVRHPADQVDAMEKGNTSPQTSPSPPPASACDVLKPLSQSGAFPSSGAVAARAREQMQTGKASPSSPGTSPTALEDPEVGSQASGSVQKRSESVQQMREIDADWVRTWRRVVTEYS